MPGRRLTVKEETTMTKDPICGMDVKEEEALNIIQFEQNTFYFCSRRCMDTYTLQPGMEKPAGKKGVFSRFLERLAKENEQSYGGTPPKCH